MAIGDIDIDTSELVSSDVEGFSDTSSISIVDALNQYLSVARFDDDKCIVLSMPESMIKRAREKLNSAIWHVYDKVSGSGITMLDIVLAVEGMIDTSTLAGMLDNDIKLCIAREREIDIGEAELDRIGMASRKDSEDDVPDDPGSAPQTEESIPEDELEIMEGLL